MTARHLLFAGLLLAAGLSACSPAAPEPTAATPGDDASAPAPVGADRDAHGCIGSAGYAWCEQAQRCERPWELASQQGFANSREAFNAYCRNPPGSAVTE